MPAAARRGGPARATVGSVKRMDRLTFEQYAAKALDRLPLPPGPVVPPAPMPSYAAEAGRWKE